MRINGAGRGAQASQSGGFDTAIRGEAGTPEVPEAGLAKSKLTIRLDAFAALALEAFGGETADGHEAGALAQRAFEALPGFLIEFAGQAQRVLSQLGFVRFERGLQMSADGVAFWSELLYPLFHDLSVAKRAEPAEEFARDFAHGGPGGIGVHLFHHGRDGTAAANGHAKIVDGVRIRRGTNVFQLPDDAVHPKRKTAMLRVRTGCQRCYGCHVRPRKSVRLSSLREDPCRTGLIG